VLFFYQDYSCSQIEIKTNCVGSHGVTVDGQPHYGEQTPEDKASGRRSGAKILQRHPVIPFLYMDRQKKPREK
jgi:hypothetical protein